MFLVAKPADGYGGKCYSVTAYRGTHESALSSAFCTNGASTVQTVTLKPQQQLSREKYNGGGTGVIAPPGITKGGVGDASSFDVGFSSYTIKRAFGDGFSNTVYRSALLFDMAGLSHKKIYSARLKLRVARTETATMTEHGNQYDYSTSCLAKIAFGADYWWEHPGWMDGAIALQPGTVVGPDVAYDVTSMVRAWTDGSRPNYGMVLLGESEDLNAFVDKSCDTTFAPAAISLEVQYSG